MTTAPAVSVLMPVYNGERYLRAAIDSVLGQRFTDFEFLIVDDGSVDGTAAIVSSYRDPRIRFERFERNRGLSAALNAGVAEARAPLVARQDADDVSRPDRLDAQVSAMRRQPGLVLLGSRARAIDGRDRVVGSVERPLEDASIRWYALFDNPFIHTSVIVRRDAVQECGGFDAAFDPFSQDYALWWRLLRSGRAANLPGRLVDYRVNAESIIGQIEGSAAGEYRLDFARIVGVLVTRHVLDAFGSRGLQADDAALMAGFILGVEAGALDRFLSVFDRLERWFEDDHPEVRGLYDFRRTLARQYDAIAYRVRPPSRRRALQVYLRAMAKHPALASTLPWSRLAATTLLGRDGRAKLARLWTHLARA